MVDVIAAIIIVIVDKLSKLKKVYEKYAFLSVQYHIKFKYRIDRIKNCESNKNVEISNISSFSL